MDTPMMRQYKQIKSQYEDHIVFFRLGDFYEMFYDDAKLCSRVLEIALTSRDTTNKVPMAGVPYHAADQYIAQLISKGYKVVICEQVGDPKASKGLVEREVVKIITPGTITDISALEETQNNYLGCMVKSRDKFGLAFVDLSTGDFHSTELTSTFPYADLLNEVARFNPRECLINPVIAEDKDLHYRFEETTNILFTQKPEVYFDEKGALDILKSNIAEDKLQELLQNKLAYIAAGTCLSYLEETHNSLFHINSINYYETQNFMGLNVSCRKNLELTQSLRDGKKSGSLLWVLDNTVTSMGARLLRRWIEQPLIDLLKIIERQDAVEELFDDFFLREDLKDLLKNVYDIQRLTGKLVCGSINARDLLAIKNTVEVLPKIKQALHSCKSKLITLLEQKIDPLVDVFTLLEKSIAEDAPVSVKEAGIIKDGYHSEIDRLRRASREGKAWLADLEKRERDRTGIKSLKVGFNRVFGYYIEVTKSNLALVPSDYSRKQTLANSERYITDELKEYETLILNAEDKLQDLEYDEFRRVREMLIQQIPRLKQSAYSISALDALLSLALAAYKNDYVKPEMTLKDNLTIVDGRHPVVEYFQRDIAFIPNDTNINNGDTMISIITGPNMAGKSTYMRQVAIIVLMAQIGSFVPAKRASIGIVDKIFTRIGAADNLASGQSTFMVEMMEVSHILKNATKKSLLILDEVGRGTSTFDGLSIAWAVLEHIHKHVKAKTLFATHYYELTALKDLPGTKNFRITVKEKGEDVIFLRKIVPGEADKSYGIQVARLAGLPVSIIKRAKELLAEHEAGDHDRVMSQIASASDSQSYQPSQIGIDFMNEQEVLEDIKAVDINSMSPLEALNFLFSIKSKLD